MPAITPETLSTLPLFRDFSPTELAMLCAVLRQSVVTARTNILTAEQPGEAVYVVLRGTVKVYRQTLCGKEVVLNICGPGEILGEMSVIDGLGHSASVVALESTTLLWMSRESFLQLLQALPTFTRSIYCMTMRRLRLATLQKESRTTQDVPGRIAYQLLSFAERCGQSAAKGGQAIPLRLTQSDLAGLIDASREEVNRALAAYKQHGYIAVEANYRITVLDREALARRCR